jgi:hypothetical protein
MIIIAGKALLLLLQLISSPIHVWISKKAIEVCLPNSYSLTINPKVNQAAKQQQDNHEITSKCANALYS